MMADKNQVEKIIYSENKDCVIDGMLGMTFSSEEDEIPWIYEQLMELSKHKDLDIARLSLTCFGHLARMHENIGDCDKVIALLRSKQNHRDFQGFAEDALNDISFFIFKKRP